MSAKDKQIGGSHYKNYAIQPVEFITRNNLGFLEGCVIKRMCRWPAKGGVEDLRKAIHEIELLIEERLRWEDEQAKLQPSPQQKAWDRDMGLAPLDAQNRAPAADSKLAPWAVSEGEDWPKKAENGTRVLVWRPRKVGGTGSQLYGWVEIGFMWDGELVPHGDVI